MEGLTKLYGRSCRCVWGGGGGVEGFVISYRSTGQVCREVWREVWREAGQTE